jgi:protein O-GlcNAc transferase
MSAGKLAQARAAAERLTTQFPNDPIPHDLLRATLMSLGQARLALVPAKRAAELWPDHAGCQESVACVLNNMGEDEESLPYAKRSVELDPHTGKFWGAVVSVLLRLNRLAEAEDYCRRGLAILPNEWQLAQMLAATLLEQGRAKDAEDVLGPVLFNDRSNILVATFLCSVSNYRSPPDRDKLLSLHKNFGRLLEVSERFQKFTHTPPQSLTPGKPAPGHGKDGRLRVGFISSDLRSHSVTYFLEPIFRHLNRSRYEIVAYQTLLKSDDTTRRLQALVAAERLPDPDNPPALNDTGPTRNWRKVTTPDGVGFARQIVDDRIDILFDLNGLTLGCRPDTLKMKPAPVIVNYLGYVSTTGMPAVNYRVVDSITDPRGCEDAATETLLRMDPCFLCYQPPKWAAETDPTRMPSLDDGVVFGSFNNFMKFNDELAAVWAKLLNAVPRSKLLLKAASLKDEVVRRATLARFEKVGLDPARVELQGTTKTPNEHLTQYDRMHIALDTFPYAGTTTTCEAIYMGVPVITLAPPSPGAMHAHRVGASLLSAIGRPELIATTPEEYVRIGVELAGDHARLHELRSSLRPRLLGSVLCDQPGFARRFEATLEHMWDQFARGRI